MATLRRMVAFVCGIAIPTLVLGDQNQDHTGLPSVAYPSDNAPTAEKAALGKTLFFDKRLSADGSISCASCHQPDHAFSDGRSKSQGIRDIVGTRNAPSLLNAAFMKTQFWDGRRPTLEAQVLDPFVNPREHGLTSFDQLIGTIKRDPTYVEMFAGAFGSDADTVSEDSVSKALACYVRTIIGGISPFDRYYYKGEQGALSPSARRGLTLFVGRAQCSTCHQIGPSEATFSDQQFHSLHVGMERIENRLPAITRRLVAIRVARQATDSTVLGDEDVAELGRFLVTLDPADIGQFRTPSLRNVALTAPYMHDGSIATLEQAVDQELYYRSAQGNRPLILTPAEKLDLVNFLRSLTGESTQSTPTPRESDLSNRKPVKP